MWRISPASSSVPYALQGQGLRRVSPAASPYFAASSPSPKLFSRSSSTSCLHDLHACSSSAIFLFHHRPEPSSAKLAHQLAPTRRHRRSRPLGSQQARGRRCRRLRCRSSAVRASPHHLRLSSVTGVTSALHFTRRKPADDGVSYFASSDLDREEILDGIFKASNGYRHMNV